MHGSRRGRTNHTSEDPHRGTAEGHPRTERGNKRSWEQANGPRRSLQDSEDRDVVADELQARRCRRASVDPNQCERKGKEGAKQGGQRAKSLSLGTNPRREERGEERWLDHCGARKHRGEQAEQSPGGGRGGHHLLVHARRSDESWRPQKDRYVGRLRVATQAMIRTSFSYVLSFGALSSLSYVLIHFPTFFLIPFPMSEIFWRIAGREASTRRLWVSVFPRRLIRSGG